MKKIIILLLALMPVSLFAQKVDKNERDEKGKRIIETEVRAMFVEESMHACQLSYSEYEGEESFLFTIAVCDQPSRWVCQNGQTVLMKDAKGKVYEIVSNGLSSSKASRNTRGTGIAYTSYIVLCLTQEEAMVFQEGLAKLRIEYTYVESESTGLKDIVIPEDMTAHLKKSYKNILKTIPLPVDVDKSVF